MAPKNKGKGKDKDESSNSKSEGGKGSGGKLKPATSINKEEALEKLRNGAKFDEVAREMSEDKARQGGSLGWKVRGSLMQDFEKVAYELEPSTTGSPKIGEVKTSEGYHIIMVEGRK
ncbi:Peptidyl-prolyl cis-trans isomerase pin4 [Alternaria postmessia]|uniref:Peptidyl-prolyl cis-trans isomerase pin4 n=1 Tax=Alternaria postmessia TaxID=1187938 RepID=UPI002224E0BD|nr:Peptidyl-prolyl cis-trans isomerase pin4 [Alternaria postmessia]KAI5375109.1 Peptidyl-prolyl cis-trans isomerase pin4 [Alternaria postmessia]